MLQLKGIVMLNRKKLSTKMNRDAYSEFRKRPRDKGVRRKRNLKYGKFSGCKYKPWKGIHLNFYSHMKRDFKSQSVRRIKGCKRARCQYI